MKRETESEREWEGFREVKGQLKNRFQEDTIWRLAFILLKIVYDRKVKKEIWKAVQGKKGNYWIEHTVGSRYNIKPRYKSSNNLKFMKSRHQRGKQIRRNYHRNICRIEGSHVTCVRMWLKSRGLDRVDYNIEYQS